MSSHATKPNSGFPLESGWEILHIKGSMAPEFLENLICYAQVQVAAHVVRTVCIAQSCAMEILRSIGDQDVLFDDDGDGDDDDNDNDSE